MNYYNFKRYKFSTVFKNINTMGNKFFKILNSIEFKRYNLKKFYKYFNLEIFQNIRNIKFLNSKFFLIHLPAFIIFFGLLYLIIPSFYNYDKSKIETLLCNKKNIECSIKGDISYNFYPTPRLKIKNLVINDFSDKKKILIAVKDTYIKLSFKNLLVKEQHKFDSAKLHDYEINFNLKDLKEYKNSLSKITGLIPIQFDAGRIIFFNGKDYVATIDNTEAKIKFNNNFIDLILKGKFLNDDIYINYSGKTIDDDKLSSDILLKMSKLNFLAKSNFTRSKKDKNINGNFLIKKDKTRITAVFDYKNDQLLINKSNLKSSFFEGDAKGEITFLPYFNFDLDLNLNNINFTKLYNNFLVLNEEEQKKLFKISNKINGKINLSSDKIYSGYDLVRSLEARVDFKNGNIFIDQLLFNLGKLGASDLVGKIDNDKKFSTLQFETNIYVDNKKKFLSKFGIYNYNKENFPSNFFISGNFDLDNTRATFYEISADEKVTNEDVNFIEKEFNESMFENGFDSLFLFPKFKEFVKTITGEID